MIIYNCQSLMVFLFFFFIRKMCTQVLFCFSFFFFLGYALPNGLPFLSHILTLHVRLVWCNELDWTCSCSFLSLFLPLCSIIRFKFHAHTKNSAVQNCNHNNITNEKKNKNPSKRRKNQSTNFLVTCSQIYSVNL